MRTISLLLVLSACALVACAQEGPPVAGHLKERAIALRGPRFALFFVGTREEMRPLVGATPGGHAATDEGAAFFIGNDSIPPALRHELMHLLSWRLWGTPATAWMSEGLATLAAGHCGRQYSIADVAAALDREQQLVPLDTLWQHFTYAAEIGAMRYMGGAHLRYSHASGARADDGRAHGGEEGREGSVSKIEGAARAQLAAEGGGEVVTQAGD